MIIVKGAIPVKSAHREEAIQLVQQLAARSLEEPGCLGYEVCLRAEDPATIVIFQQWTDLAALEAHFGSLHVDGFLDAIPDLIEGQVESARFDVMAGEAAELIEELQEASSVQLAGNTVLH